jgi:hypothetical protein
MAAVCQLRMPEYSIDDGWELVVEYEGKIKRVVGEVWVMMPNYYSSLLNLVNNPIGFFEFIIKAYQNNERDKSIINSAIIDLNKNDKFDICDCALQAIEKGYNIFNICDVFEKIIHRLNISILSLFEYFKRLFAVMQGNAIAYKQYIQIINITKEQPAFASQFLQHLIDSGDVFIPQYIVEIINNLPDLSLIDRHKKFKVFISHKSEAVVLSGVIGLGSLPYNIATDKILIDETIRVLDQACRNTPNQINQYIVDTLGRLYSLGINTLPQLLILSKKDDQYILFAISKFLNREYKKIDDATIFYALLTSLSKVSADCRGTIENIDFILYSLLIDASQKDVFLGFIITWSQNENFQYCLDKMDTFLQCTLSQYNCNRALFHTLITRLFNDNCSNSHQMAAKIILDLTTSGFDDIEMDTDIIVSMNLEDVIFVSRKILAYIFHENTLCVLFFSFLKTFIKNDFIRPVIIDIFINHIGYNYPNTTLNYFKRMTKNDSEDKDILKHITTIITTLEDKEKCYKYFNEFIPMKKNYFLFALEEKKAMQKNIKKSSEHLFINSIPKVNIKYGKKFSSYYNGKYSEPSGYADLSCSFEIPKSEIFSPVSEAIQRYGFKVAKRGEK